MRLLFRGGAVFAGGKLRGADAFIDGGRIASVGAGIPPEAADEIVNCIGKVVIPGFADAHTHLREPGFSYKETVRAGTLAAARGGYTQVLTMPNVEPAPDDPGHLEAQAAILRRDAAVRARPFGAITRGRLGREPSDIEALAPHVAGFSDDGAGVMDEGVMRAAMARIARAGGILAAHCEDASIAGAGVAHDGAFARFAGLAGIPSEAEWRPLKRDLRLVRETGCRYHLLHASCAESVALIREAKRAGLPVTAEAAPHSLLLHDGRIENDGRFKMNPPIRALRDRDALVEGLIDGAIDLIATDHAPHSAAEKAGGFRDAAMGVVGLETAFPALHTGLVKTGILSLEKLLALLCDAPRRVFGLPGGLREGGEADLAVLDLERAYEIRPEGFLSMGRSTPFEGWRVFGACERTLVDGRAVWEAKHGR